jgi:hypothetical protein
MVSIETLLTCTMTSLSITLQSCRTRHTASTCL